MNNINTLLLVAAGLITLCIQQEATANTHYNSSRAPLLETPFVRLPLGSVQAEGWLLQQLILQKDGLTGHAEELYGDIGESAWIGGANDSWERGPYYAKGLIPLAYILNDAELINTSQKWIDKVIESQRADGDFGPRNKNWWPNMIVLYYMRDYYEATNDDRVIPFMNKYFQFQLHALSSSTLESESGWAKARGGDNIDVVLWLYNQTGKTNLLALADLLNEQSNQWTPYYSDGTGNNWRPDHIVNVMQGLKRPPLWYLRSGSEADRDAYMEATGKDGWLMKSYGRIDAMYNGTEPLSDLSSTEGTELCAIVERILSSAIALRVLGNPVIGDQLETVAYNALPGNLKYDIKGLRYYLLMNQPKSTNEDLGFNHNGNGQNAICPSPHSGYGCCRSNFHFGWPKFVQHMWMGTHDNGLAVAAYGPSRVTAKVGRGVTVTIAEKTDYPFRDTITLKVTTPARVKFPLKLRIPGWCKSPEVKVNGTLMKGVQAGTYYTIDRRWSDGDTVLITFPMKIRTSVWINNSIGLERGPLIYSLLIGETWTETATYLDGKFKTEEIRPATPWNYGLTLADLDNPDADITVEETAMPLQPFKASDAPIKLRLNAKKVPSWGTYRTDLPGRATEPPLSPVESSEPIEQVTLVPFGSTEIRTTYFPYVGEDDYSGFSFPITAQAGYGGTISPCGTMIVPVGGTRTFSISALPGCTIKHVYVNGTNVGAVSTYTLKKIPAAPHTINASFNVQTGKGSIPKKKELLLACDADALPDSGMIDSWKTAVPVGGSVERIESPEVEVIDGKKFVDNSHSDGDGFLFKTYEKPVKCNGVSVVVVAKPIRDGDSSSWASIIDIFYDRLVLGIKGDTGKVVVRRNGSTQESEAALPNGQTTILSMIVQANGRYKVYANGVEVISDDTTSDMTALVPKVAGPYANSITIGRNSPDGWSTFNGKIGDIYLYKTALSDTERGDLEAYITAKLIHNSSSAKPKETRDRATVPIEKSSAVRYRIDTTKPFGDINIDIYGQFLEHIFNSVHGGLWGDMILNPSFELRPAAATWVIEEGVIKTQKLAEPTPLLIGSTNWTDCEITLEAALTNGNAAFNIPFRWQDSDNYYMMNFGIAGHMKWSLLKRAGGHESFIYEMNKERPGLEKGKWYRLKIRIEGAHIQVWLDDEKIVDIDDTSGKNKPALLQGKAGVNCVWSQPLYRNITVKTLNGTELYTGLPGAHDMSVQLPYWKLYGKGSIQTAKDGVISGRDAIVITGTKDGETGLEQGPMALQAGETYGMSVYLRARKAGVTAVMRMLGDTGEEEFAKRIGPLSTEWKKYKVVFKSKTDVKSAVLQIGVKGQRTVMVDMASMFSKSAMECGGFRPDVLKLIADEQPANIRYPGGCFASGYRWKDGIGPREKRTYFPWIIWADQDPNQMGTDEFMDLCRRVKAEPILPVNIDLGVQEALDWLEYCNGSAETTWGTVRAENGHPEPYNVRYWEIDNEKWGMGPERYAAAVTNFSTALRAKDPTLKIIACGGYGYDDGAGSTKEWNQKLLDLSAESFDYLSIHYYNGIAYKQDYVDDPTKYEEYIRNEIGPMIRNSANPKMLVYCSEWGMMNDTWRSGLYTGGVLNGFERLNGLLTMSCPAVWLQRVTRKRPNPRWGSCSIVFDHATAFGTPTHVVEKLWRESYQPKRLAVQGPEKALNVIAALSLDGKTVTFKAVNTGGDAVEVNVTVDGPRKIGSAAMQVVAPGDTGARNTLDEPEAIKPAAAQVRVEGKTVEFSMPALSVGVVTMTLE